MTSWSASANMATPWLERMFEYSSGIPDTEGREVPRVGDANLRRL
jgi:hypothetical protein